MKFDTTQMNEADAQKALREMVRQGLIVEPGWPWKYGDHIMVCTVTRWWLGAFVLVTKKLIVLEKTSWIAQEGAIRETWWQGFKAGKRSRPEIEVLPPPGIRVIERGAVVDYGLWPHALPTNHM